MITKTDVERLKEDFTPRDELGEMFALVATKNDLNEGLALLRAETKEGFRVMMDEFARTRREIYDLLDPYSKKVDDCDAETKVYGTQLRPDLALSQRLYPHQHDTIGFFICLIERNK